MTIPKQLALRFTPFCRSLLSGRRLLVFKLLVYGIIAFGILLRLAQFLSDRSLWLDEACLALNIVNRSYAQLFEPLDYGQAAPVGFLFVEKTFVNIFHNSDSILRLFPLLCGLASLFLFYKLLKHEVSKTSGLFALALFALSDELVYYSSSLKPYISDVFTALTLYLMAFHFESGKLNLSRMVVLTLAGAISVWISYPALFVLAGLGSTSILVYLFRKDFSRLFRLTIVYLIWGLSFITLYLTTLRHPVQQNGLLHYWALSFMPFPPANVSDFLWILDKFVSIFQSPAQIKLTTLAIILFLAGSISMIFCRRKTFFLLISPMFFALIASGFHKYPFHGRLLLFLLPSLYFIIAAGADRISFNSMTVKVLLLGLLVYHPFIIACHHLTQPRVNEEIKPVMQFIKQNWEPDHLLYVYHKSQPAFDYYARQYGFTRESCVIGGSSKHDPKAYLSDLDKLDGTQRVWILLTHFHENEIKVLSKHLNRIGVRLRAFKAPGAVAFLYNLG